MPSPRAPSPTTSKPSSAAMHRSDQELLIARAAADRRGDDAGQAPAGLGAKPVRDKPDRALPVGSSAYDAALAYGAAPGLELRLDQADQPGLRRRQGQGRRQGLGERDEADIGDDG